ncbi:MAG: response regulator [Anaerolineae bacterium]|nr:response regulator [Anaerolineae bacterium]
MSQTEPTQFEKKRIRVLIVDDRPETRESLRKMLEFESDMEVVGEAATGEAAIEQTGLLGPDIVLMDLNMPGMDGMAATEIITKQYPFAHVIMMSVEGGGESVRRSMLSGARDFLVKPFTSDELASSIRRVYELEAGRRVPFEAVVTPIKPAEPAPVAARKRGKLITVFSPKGGTGSSTIAVNLAVALQRPGRRTVVLVDGNLQFGDVAALLNLRPLRSSGDLVPLVSAGLDAHVVNAVLTPHASGIKVLLAPDNLEAADLVTAQHMGAILGQLQEMFDYVIVDTKGFLYDLILRILDMSDRVLLVATPDIPALKSVRQFLTFAESLGGHADRYALIINEADRPGAVEIHDIEASLKKKVDKHLPEDRLTVIQASSEGIPLVSSSPKSPLAQAIVELAMWLMNELEVRGREGESAEAAPSRRRWPLFGKKRRNPEPEA